jgi:hypothetical protein
MDKGNDGGGRGFQLASGRVEVIILTVVGLFPARCQSPGSALLSRLISTHNCSQFMLPEKSQSRPSFRSCPLRADPSTT